MKYLLLIATFFTFSLSLNSQVVGITLVSNTNIDDATVVGGVEDWSEDIEVKGGVEDWNEDIEVKGGVEDWNEDIEVKGGVEDWNEDIEVKGGVEDWNEDIEMIMNGCTSCESDGLDVKYYDEFGNEISFDNFNNRKNDKGSTAYVIIIDGSNRKVIRITF